MSQDLVNNSSESDSLYIQESIQPEKANTPMTTQKKLLKGEKCVFAPQVPKPPSKFKTIATALQAAQYIGKYNLQSFKKASLEIKKCNRFHETISNDLIKVKSKELAQEQINMQKQMEEQNSSPMGSVDVSSSSEQFSEAQLRKARNSKLITSSSMVLGVKLQKKNTMIVNEIRRQFQKENNLSYSVDDISSIEEAGIDSCLIQHQFLEKSERKSESKQLIIDRYSKIFGLVRHKTLQYNHKILYSLRQDQKPDDPLYHVKQCQIVNLELKLDLMEKEAYGHEEHLPNLAQDPKTISEHEQYDHLYRIEQDQKFLRNKLFTTKANKKKQKLQQQAQGRRQYILRYTIRQDTIYFEIWTIFSLCNCLVSTLSYPYFMIAGVESNSVEFWMMIWFESIFFMEMVINFVKQDLDDDGKTKYDLPGKIAQKYLQSNFVVDLIALIPWGYILDFYNPNFSFLWVVKAIRIKTLLEMMSNKKILPPIKTYITNQQKKTLDDPFLKYQVDEDSVNITKKIFLINSVKTFRLVLQTMILAYFVGSFWYYFTYIVHSYHESETDSFIYYRDHWDLLSEQPSSQILISMYFAFTSLSTVGFGDFYPVSDLERVVGSFVLLIGVAMFSYILGELLVNIQVINQIEAGFEKSDDLDRFFSLLQRFNRQEPIDKKIQSEIRNYFKEKWQKDKNNFLIEEKDCQLFDQLPSETKITIYTEFMFKNFLFRFRKFFDFYRQYKDRRSDDQYTNSLKKTRIIARFQRAVNTVIKGFKKNKMAQAFKKIVEKKVEQNDLQLKIEQYQSQQQNFDKQRDKMENITRIKYPFFRWQFDHNFQNFLTRLLQSLELRFFASKEIIHQELDECLEVIFVETGKYDYGYEINKKKIYRIQFGYSTLIGGFEMNFQQRFQFNIRANSEITGYGIRKKNWLSILGDNPLIAQQIDQKVLSNYFRNIMKPLSQHKQNDIQKIGKRNDFHTILSLSQDTKKFVQQYFANDQELDENDKQNKNEHSKIPWLINLFEKKFNKYQKMSFNVMKNSEKVRTILKEMLISIIQTYNYTQRQAVYDLVRKVEDQLYNFQEQIEIKVLNRKSYNIAQFEQNIKLLGQSINPETKFQELYYYANNPQRITLKRSGTINYLKDMSNVLVSNKLTKNFGSAKVGQNYSDSSDIQEDEEIYDSLIKNSTPQKEEENLEVPKPEKESENQYELSRKISSIVASPRTQQAENNASIIESQEMPNIQDRILADMVSEPKPSLKMNNFIDNSAPHLKKKKSNLKNSILRVNKLAESIIDM